MKKLLYVCIAMLMAFSTGTALAADVSGGWTGEIETGNGAIQLTFTFKQDGAKLTGTIQGPGGDPLPINDGKVDGDKISFSVDFNGATISHKGTVTGDTIKLTSEGGGMGGEMTLKRAPAKAAAPPAG